MVVLLYNYNSMDDSEKKNDDEREAEGRTKSGFLPINIKALATTMSLS